ncbi:hypothetical protein Ahy_A09g046385 [Arachis hypogaea]|uniref:Disease resistance RPP13-like protein 1 n=1 Tax=Arachis hypogaea TaxID=3818 RepID=A0A445BPS0_ARAHY|nr:hypothetical protein Ahy_A09g046385 [Arachis hypogaea]
MAAKIEGRAYLSSFVDVVSKKLSSILEDDFVLERNDSELKLLERLDNCLCDVGPVLDDAELKQFSDERVKKWLVDLQDALYMADDFLDELSTRAATATPRDLGNSFDWSRPVDSIIEDSAVNVIENIVGKLESGKKMIPVMPNIVGMGGIGKITLAQLVYNDAEIVGKFDTRAWVCVVENPDPVNVTRTIIGAIDSFPCNMSLDDVWDD